MKAFISYSIHDSEQFVVSSLSAKLWEKEFSVTSSSTRQFAQSGLDLLATMNIKESSLFVGVITARGMHHQKVIAEHHFAVSKKVPALLLVEENVQLPPDFVNCNVVTFNREHPHQAIEKINKNIQNMADAAVHAQNGSTQNVAAWLFGGGALIGLVNSLAVARE